MYGGLPNTGLNFSTPIYLLVALAMLLSGAVMVVIGKLRGGNA